jgi:hypothetical protein
LIISLGGGYWFAKREGLSEKYIILSLAISLILIFISLLAANAFYDLSWDGLWYHETAGIKCRTVGTRFTISWKNYINSEYTKPELLPHKINLPQFLNWTPFIAPYESYLLFSSTHTGSHR